MTIEKPPIEPTKGLTITNQAAVQIRRLLAAERPGMAIRIEASPHGHGMQLDDRLTQDDQLLDEDGIRVIVDRYSLAQLAGCVLDYREGLTNAGFFIQNPNASSGCGCGKGTCGCGHQH